MRAAYDAGMRLFDTAPLYGHGLSEHRIGEALRWLDRDSYVLSTKVGRLLRPRDPTTSTAGVFKQVLPFEGVYDYSYDGVMRSVDDSLQRLGMHRIDVLLIHDVDVWTHGSEAARLQRFKRGDGRRLPCACCKLREEGVVRAIGAGINEIQACEDFARAGDFDCFLLAGRYTLLEQAALDTLLPYCAEKDISLLIGGPYNTGILATGAVAWGLLQLRPGAGRDHGAGGQDRGGLRPPRRSAGQRRAAVPARPSQRGDTDSRRPLARGDRPEPRHLRGRHPGGVLGRAEARRAAARGRADAGLSSGWSINLPRQRRMGCWTGPSLAS